MTTLKRLLAICTITILAACGGDTKKPDENYSGDFGTHYDGFTNRSFRCTRDIGWCYEISNEEANND